MVKDKICNDQIHTFSSGDCYFRIASNNVILYEGRAKAKPGQANASIYVNRICQNYLHNTLEGTTIVSSTQVNSTDAYRAFDVLQYNPANDSWITGETYWFLWDWDYDSDVSFTGSYVLSNPINRHYTPSQLVALTTFSGGTIGSVHTVLSADATGKHCGDYSLIYRNLRGGFDSFLFEGKCKRLDNFERTTMKKDNNNTLNQFRDITYLNGIKPKWELSTSFLTDYESREFAKNLVSSTECYLQCMTTGKVYPVVITDTQVNYKKLNTNGNDPVFYTITVELSDDRMIY